MSNNKFLNTDTGNTFVNDGSLNLYVNNIKIAGLEPLMPVMTDNKNNLISTSTVGVGFGSLTLTAQTDVQITPVSGNINMQPYGGTGNVNIFASDLTINNRSLIPQYANAVITTGQVISPSSTLIIPLATSSVSFSSQNLTITSNSIQINETGIYNVIYTDNIGIISGSVTYQASILQNGVVNPSLNFVNTITPGPSELIVLNSLIQVTSGDILQLQYTNRVVSTGSLRVNNSTIVVIKVA
jgi:hypothetical protein